MVISCLFRNKKQITVSIGLGYIVVLRSLPISICFIFLFQNEVFSKNIIWKKIEYYFLKLV
jgi:hypothetical protein